MSQTEVQLVKGLNLDPAAPADATKVDSSGRFLVGTSTSATGQQIESASTGGNNLGVIRYENGAGCSEIILAHSRSGTIGTNTVLSSGDRIGDVVFRGADGTNYVDAASISAHVDGTPGANDMPGRLVFSTTADGASSPTERMRISSSGQVMIGTTSSGNANADELTLENSSGAAGVTIRAAANFNSNIYFADPGSATIGQIEYRHNGDTMRFYTFGSEVMRTTSTGELMFNSGYGSVATAYGCRAWVNFSGSGTISIRDSGNVSSITDVATGKYTVNFSSNMPDSSYTAVVSVIKDNSTDNCDLYGCLGAAGNSSRVPLAGSVPVTTSRVFNSQLVDTPIVNVLVIR